MSFEILGVDLYHILSWFIVYSFMGWIWGGDRLRDLTSGGRKHPGTLFCRGGSRYDSGIRDRCTDGSHFSHQLVGLQR